MLLEDRVAIVTGGASAGALLGGVHTPSNLAAITDEAWDRMVDLNLKGAFLCCREVAPRMQANKYGKIVNISSIGAVHPPKPTAHYNSALGLTYDMAAEFARYVTGVALPVAGGLSSRMRRFRFSPWLPGASGADFSKMPAVRLQAGGRPGRLPTTS